MEKCGFYILWLWNLQTRRVTGYLIIFKKASYNFFGFHSTGLAIQEKGI